MKLTFHLLFSASFFSFCILCGMEGDQRNSKLSEMPDMYEVPSGPSLFPAEITFCAAGLPLPTAGMPLICKQTTSITEKKALSDKLTLIILTSEQLAKILANEQKVIDQFSSIKKTTNDTDVPREKVIAATIKHLEHIKQLAHQEKTDPDMDNLRMALESLVPFDFKYLAKEGDVSTNYAKSIGNQRKVVTSSTQDYQLTMQKYLNEYCNDRLQQPQELKELKEKFAYVHVEDNPEIQYSPEPYGILSADH